MKKTALVLAVVFAFSGFTAVAKETKKSDVVKLQKQVQAYKDVILERNKKIEELQKKIAELEAKLAPAAPAAAQ